MLINDLHLMSISHILKRAVDVIFADYIYHSHKNQKDSLETRAALI